MLRELVLVAVDLPGFQLEVETALFDYLVGGNGRFHYSHDPFGGIGKGIVARMHANQAGNSYWASVWASARITGGMAHDMAEGIVMLPVDMVEGLAEGNPEKSGKATGVIAAFFLPAAKMPRLGKRFGAFTRELVLSAALRNPFPRVQLPTNRVPIEIRAPLNPSPALLTPIAGNPLVGFGSANNLYKMLMQFRLQQVKQEIAELTARVQQLHPQLVKSRFVCKSGGSSSPSARLLGRPPVSGGVRGRGNAGRPRRVWS